MNYNAAKYLNNWTNVKFTPSRLATAKTIVAKLAKNKESYSKVERLTGVPWWWILIVHNREASGRFDTYLGNGDPLDEVSTHVPAGRGPFPSWEAGAVDALKLKSLHKLKDWSIPRALYEFERYNGFGYALKGLPSPYVWAGSSIYTKGKYVEDHVYDPNVIDTQLGAATMLQALLSLGLLQAITGGGAGAQQGAGVTVTNTTTTTNLLGVAIGAIIGVLGASGFGADAMHTIGSIAGFIAMIAAGVNQLHITSASNANTLDLIAKIAGQVRDQADQAADKASAPPPLTNERPVEVANG